MNDKDMHTTHDAQMDHQTMNHNKDYRNLLIMIAISFISMYILMFAMVNVLGNVFNNLNNLYMAGLMAAPMIPIELIVMRKMYPDKKRNAIFITTSVIAVLIFFSFIRQQAAVSDKQFLRSMIPHHASAILMCERASINDPEIKQLCEQIVSGQQSEIDQMRAKLDELEK